MLSRFAKKTVEIVGNKSIAFFNPSGFDTTEHAVSFARHVRKHNSSYTSLISEFPCIGVPRLAFEVPGTYAKENSMDQLLLDFDRDAMKSLDSYIVKNDEFDLIPAYDKNKPEYPTLLNVSREETLREIPGYIKSHYQFDYKFLLFPLQGQLFHSLTFYTLRHADFVVISINNPKELPWAYISYSKLIEVFGIPKESIALYAPFSMKDFKEEVILHKMADVLQKVGETNWQPELLIQPNM